MASTFGGLNTLVRGLYAQQVALNTVGHNISNANTEGYSRQSVNTVSSTPEQIYGGNGSLQLGTGVLVESINRIRDTFVDRQMWKESASLGYGQTLNDAMSKIEEVFQEPTTNGMQSVMNQFWSAWQTLGKDGSDTGARSALIQRGVELVDSIQNAGQKFCDQAADINSVIDIKVNKVNQLSSEIFSLNKQISALEMGNKGQANDLRDQRDNLVDQMSSMIKVTVNEDQYGHYNIQAAGVTLVSATDLVKLGTVSSPDAKYGYELKNVVVEGSNKILDLGNGEIKAMVDVRDSEEYGIKAYLNNLDTMSNFLLKDFNDVHKTGYDINNDAGINFFGDTGVNYSTGTLPADAGTWLTNLKVNPELLKIDGTAKVAAKTLATIEQSNIKGGPATLSGAYTGAATPVENFTVRIDSVAAGGTGKVTGASYSTDDGQTWTTANPSFVLSDGVSTGEIPKKSVNDTFNVLSQNKTFTVKVTSVATDGTVTGVIYTTDTTIPEAKWPSATPDTFTLSDGISIKLAADKDNTPADLTTTPITTKDTYKFTMPPQNNAAGDNAYRLAQGMKVDIRQILGDTYKATLDESVSLDSFYNGFIGAVGVQTQNAKTQATNQQTLVNQLTNWRESTAGVNMDEEMTNMIRFQKGYNAAARVVTTLDEMLDKLINSTGVVGR